LGILAQADREGDLDSLSDALDRLEDEAGFWIDSALREQILGGPK
jgi:predicted nucleic acid-binding protein